MKSELFSFMDCVFDVTTDESLPNALSLNDFLHFLLEVF